MPDSQQIVFSEPCAKWRVELSRTWDVLGPFPIHAREQQFLSPAFPLNLLEPIDFEKTWPSSYADGGKVGWNQTRSDEAGQLLVSFPDIRWKALRATEGWAALQHHAVLRSQLTVYPPESGVTVADAPRLLVNLIQASYFTILPSSRHNEPPRWQAGNIYDLERALPRAMDLPIAPSTTEPTTYDIFVSGDYEIRLFGDPNYHGSDVPVQTINLTVDIESIANEVVREPTQDVVFDFVDGYAFGDAIGVGIRSVSGWWTVTSVAATQDGIQLDLERETRLAPSQTRIVPVRVTQTQRFDLQVLSMDVHLSRGDETKVISVSLTVNQVPQWSSAPLDAIKGTYFFARSMPTVFYAIPPLNENQGAPRPPILALHGAGVDIVAEPFWAQSLPRNNHSWFVLPTGRTSWGLDWRGPSTQDAWGSLDALVAILEANSVWHAWKLTENTPAVVMGHSNGAQGAWYLASRYPDRVLGVVPAAGYIKAQAYVPLTISRSAHFIDPALRAILESSLTPDDNDLFLANLVDTPVLAIHGGIDENVPVWHTRELVSVLQTLVPDANVTYIEDPGELHWYPSVLNNGRVQGFLDDVLSSWSSRSPSQSFTVTVSVPAESGSLHGWRIECLAIPGRLGKLYVGSTNGHDVQVITSNVKGFSIDIDTFSLTSLRVDNSDIRISDTTTGVIHLEAVEPKVWRMREEKNTIQVSGRMQTILSSTGPISLVVPDDLDGQELSVALRIAHDLHTYHRLDSQIVRTSEAFDPDILDGGNIVVIGNQATLAFTKLHSSKVITSLPAITRPGSGIMFTHSHPTHPEGKMVFIQSTDPAGLEKAARLFPIRTGVTVPDWIIVGEQADQIGAAGVLGAGVWGNDWSWNEATAWTF